MSTNKLVDTLEPEAAGILRRIAEDRIARLATATDDPGAGNPPRPARPRPPGRLPVVPFLSPPGVICEIKRRSPSAGAIAAGLDAPEQAARYAAAGVRTVSVLTEEGQFGGSLEDLIRSKEANPHLSILRKDFLLSVDDIDESFAAGADAVLLIAGLLKTEALTALLAAATKLGLAALVEVHNAAEVEKVRRLAPPLVGINSRDLTSFEVDAFVPLGLIGSIDWSCRVVFESGISHAEDARLAVEEGFTGVLVGEAVVRRPKLIPELIAAVEGAAASRPAGPQLPGVVATAPGFWRRLAEARSRRHRPLVKVCGITNLLDARRAVDLGADVLGFVFADSPRRAEPALLRELRSLPVPKVGVVVTTGADRRLPDGVAELLDSGFLDAIQLHGDEEPGLCGEVAFPYYKAVRVSGSRDLDVVGSYACPRVLLDRYDPTRAGGTGRQIDADVLSSKALPRPLWLAGGLGPDNVAAAIEEYRPELIDASSRLEAEPGRKDPSKLRRFFQEVNRE